MPNSPKCYEYYEKLKNAILARPGGKITASYDDIRQRLDHEDNLFFSRSNAMLTIQSIFVLLTFTIYGFILPMIGNSATKNHKIILSIFIVLVLLTGICLSIYLCRFAEKHIFLISRFHGIIKKMNDRPLGNIIIESCELNIGIFSQSSFYVVISRFFCHLWITIFTLIIIHGIVIKFPTLNNLHQDAFSIFALMVIVNLFLKITYDLFWGFCGGNDKKQCEGCCRYLVPTDGPGKPTFTKLDDFF